MEDKNRKKTLERYTMLLAMLNMIKKDTSFEEGVALTEQEYNRILCRLQKKYEVYF